MDDKEKTTETKTELEKFIEEHRDFFEKYRRIGQEVEEEMAEIAAREAEHPEMYDTEYQLEVTNRFLDDNPDVKRITLDTKNGDE